MRKTIRMQELHWGNLLFIWTRYEHSFRPHAWCPPVCLSPFPVAVFSIFCFLLLSDDCEELVQVRQDRVKMERKYGTPQKTVLDSWFTNPVQPAGIFIELHYKDKFNVRTDEPRFVLFFANIHPIHFDGTPPAGQGVKQWSCERHGGDGVHSFTKTGRQRRASYATIWEWIVDARADLSACTVVGAFAKAVIISEKLHGNVTDSDNDKRVPGMFDAQLFILDTEDDAFDKKITITWLHC